ncbi:MAG: GTP-dependent dephospho-CoA kinase family protein [archaeon]|nr:GTP-dependent dephospho-CoA kinase family protein [archaeon]
MSYKVLPPEKRAEFQKPIGFDLDEKDLGSLNANKRLITVGDVVSFTVRKHGIVPCISIYDGYTERREITDFADLVKREGLDETVVVNPAGTISSELIDAVRNAFDGRTDTIIRVEGEEDLALLPCVLFAPADSVVIYGWPGKGMKAVYSDGPDRTRIEELFDMLEESI